MCGKIKVHLNLAFYTVFHNFDCSLFNGNLYDLVLVKFKITKKKKIVF